MGRPDEAQGSGVMDPWPFIIASYGLVGAATLLLVARAYGRLRAAEKKLRK